MTEKTISASIVEAAKIIAKSMDKRTEEIKRFRLSLCGYEDNGDTLFESIDNIANALMSIDGSISHSEVGKALGGLSQIPSINDGIDNSIDRMSDAICELAYAIKKGCIHEKDQN